MFAIHQNENPLFLNGQKGRLRNVPFLKGIQKQYIFVQFLDGERGHFNFSI